MASSVTTDSCFNHEKVGQVNWDFRTPTTHTKAGLTDSKTQLNRDLLTAKTPVNWDVLTTDPRKVGLADG